MTITVTMKQTRRGTDGSPLLAGQNYDLADDFACYLIGANLATDTNHALVPRGIVGAFTLLADCPAEIYPGGIVVGNADGDGLTFNEWCEITEENGVTFGLPNDKPFSMNARDVTITAQGDQGVAINANGTGSFSASGANVALYVANGGILELSGVRTNTSGSMPANYNAKLMIRVDGANYYLPLITAA